MAIPMSSRDSMSEPSLRQLFRTSTLSWLAVLALALLIGLKTNWQAPPRFDGAGYAVLAESLRTGQGYRAIEHPDAPRHAHFPPGYPVALATVWTFTGPSFPVAHGFSLACTIGAVLLFRRWLNARMPALPASLLTAALAINWTWGRVGGAIQSEPLFLLLSSGLLVASDQARGKSFLAWIGLGALAAGCVLTRQVGIMLAAAVGIDLFWNRGPRALFTYLLALGLGLLPWLCWLLNVQAGTQAELLPTQGLGELISSQANFYLLRIPDQLFGPLNEVATIFRPRWWLVGYGWGLLATGTILAGLAFTLRQPRWRLAGLGFFLTMALLLVWPFQEAGRFLIPLVPFLLLGAWISLEFLAQTWKPRFPHTHRLTPGARAAWFLLALSLPYSLYSLIPRKASQPASFDAACQWIADQGRKPGPVITRQGGEAFWLMNRKRTVVPAPAPESTQTIGSVIEKYQVAYLIDDADRYARALPGTVAQFAAESPQRVVPVRTEGPVTVYEIRDSATKP